MMPEILCKIDTIAGIGKRIVNKSRFFGLTMRTVNILPFKKAEFG